MILFKTNREYIIMDDLYDDIFMEFIQVLSENYDQGLDKATNVSEQLTEFVRQRVEEELSNAE